MLQAFNMLRAFNIEAMLKVPWCHAAYQSQQNKTAANYVIFSSLCFQLPWSDDGPPFYILVLLIYPIYSM
jgi:hypothetical protein